METDADGSWTATQGVQDSTLSYPEDSGGAAGAAAPLRVLAVTGEYQFPESWGAANAFPLGSAAFWALMLVL